MKLFFKAIVGLIIFYASFGFCTDSVNGSSEGNQKTQYVGRDVGKEAARKYFEPKGATRQPSQDASFSGEHYLALHFGRHLGAEAWNWNGTESQKDFAQNSIGVTYRISEWEQVADKNLRVDFNEYLVGSDKFYKLSFLPLVTFPDAKSQFPLYFGLGAGLGVFFRQSPGESSLTFDYQLIAGARFFNVYNSMGFFFEGGLKNHLHLFSDGQLNATFAALGMVFTF